MLSDGLELNPYLLHLQATPPPPDKPWPRAACSSVSLSISIHRIMPFCTPAMQHYAWGGKYDDENNQTAFYRPWCVSFFERTVAQIAAAHAVSTARGELLSGT